ncbi:hypothetical protein HUJ04_012188 [Dendroctonus ponderosae]|nr:hypothetical protein HUJ04_012188 [Dendroctonus ponderosae]
MAEVHDIPIFQPDEMSAAIDKLKIKKSPRPDNLPAEIVKAIGKNNGNLLRQVLSVEHRMLQDMMDSPTNWKEGEFIIRAIMSAKCKDEQAFKRDEDCDDFRDVFINVSKDLKVKGEYKGTGYVGIELEKLIMFSVYFSLNGDNEDFEKLLNDLEHPQSNRHERTNRRGTLLEDWMSANDLVAVNRGSTPTLSGSRGEFLIDVTIATIPVAEKIKNWQVLTAEENMSDHHSITFNYGSGPSPWNSKAQAANTQRWTANPKTVAKFTKTLAQLVQQHPNVDATVCDAILKKKSPTGKKTLLYSSARWRKQEAAAASQKVVRIVAIHYIERCFTERLRKMVEVISRGQHQSCYIYINVKRATKQQTTRQRAPAQDVNAEGRTYSDVLTERERNDNVIITTEEGKTRLDAPRKAIEEEESKLRVRDTTRSMEGVHITGQDITATRKEVAAELEKLLGKFDEANLKMNEMTPNAGSTEALTQPGKSPGRAAPAEALSTGGFFPSQNREANKRAEVQEVLGI